jgi:hypothetical protein
MCCFSIVANLSVRKAKVITCILIFSTIHIIGVRVTVVGIATCYALDGPVFDPLGGQGISLRQNPLRPAIEPT